MNSAGRISSAVFFDRPTRKLPHQINVHFDAARSKEQLGLVIFPNLRTELEVVGLVNALCTHARWSCAIDVSVKKRTALDLRWRSTDELSSSAIGFAPLGMMPLTRRAPYVALAVWPGGRDNHFKKKPHDFVGVGDMSHDYEKREYDRLFRTTRSQVGSVRDVLAEEGVVTGVTFAFSKDTRQHVDTS